MLQNNLKQHVYVPQDQHSSIAPPPQEDTDSTPLLTEADLAQFTTRPSLTDLSQLGSPPSNPSSGSVSPANPSAVELPQTAQSPAAAAPTDAQAASLAQPPEGAVQTSTSQAVSIDSPQQMAEDQANAQQQIHAHAEAKAQAQAQAEGKPPSPDWQAAPTDAEPVSSLGTLTAAGSQAGTGSIIESSTDSVLRSQDWQAASVVPAGLVLQPVAGQIGAPLLQTPTQLPVFAVDSVLWPNQLMMLR